MKRILLLIIVTGFFSAVQAQSNSGYMGRMNLVSAGLDFRLFPFPPAPGFQFEYERVINNQKGFGISYLKRGIKPDDRSYAYTKYDGIVMAPDAGFSTTQITLKYTGYKDIAPLGVFMTYGLGRHVVKGDESGELSLRELSNGNPVRSFTQDKKFVGTELHIALGTRYIMKGGNVFGQFSGSYSYVFFASDLESNGSTDEVENLVNYALDDIYDSVISGFAVNMKIGYLF